ncbi:MAG TPA: type I-U CRISPR-associated protein Cas7, partial [Elusimicrobiota bacterium]|nr:type I-U CRISPR-associated protein Cas7 [Elusimicrobiota bacterium]
NGAKVPCVLLDSVQAQANRLEEALQRALDAGTLKNVPVLNVVLVRQSWDEVRPSTATWM